MKSHGTEVSCEHGDPLGEAESVFLEEERRLFLDRVDGEEVQMTAVCVAG